MERLTSFAILCLTILSLSANAATNYVAPSSVGGGAGTNEATAMAISTALAAASPGDTLLAVPGDYGTIAISQHLITLQSIRKWGAKVIATSTHGLYGNDGYHSNRIRGFYIHKSWIDGIKPGGNAWTIEDCWIHMSGKGDPMATTNTTFSPSGQGIGMHAKHSWLIQRNLITDGGLTLNGDHGMYMSGSNWIARFNVSRSNLTWGIQAYHGTGENDNGQLYGNLVYGNGNIPGSGGGGIVFESHNSSKTNRIFNNTLDAYRYGMIVRGPGSFSIFNNIVFSGNGYDNISTNSSGVFADFNWRNDTTGTTATGPNDIVTATFTRSTFFPNYALGQYWNTATAVTRGAATSQTVSDIDWFGNPVIARKDIGSHPYDYELANDDRDMNAAGTDFWLPPPTKVAVNGNPIAHMVTWNENGDNYHWDGAQVWRKAGAGSYSKIADVAKGQAFYSDSISPLGHGTVYTYKVTLTNLYSRGPWSREVAITCDKLSISHASQRVGWGDSFQGVPGDIPTGYTVFCNAASSIPGTNIVAASNGTDATPAIEAALRLAAASGSNLVVTLPAGTFTLKQTLSIGGKSGFTKANNIILRGAGTNATILQAAFTNLTGAIVNFGGYSESSTDRILNADLPIGGSTLTLANVSGITAGTMIKVWQDKADDVEGAYADGSDDPIHYSNNGSSKSASSAPVVRQMFMVTGVSGNDVTVTPPSVFLFRSEDAICHNFTTYETRYSGIENLTIRNLSGVQGTNIDKIIYMSQTAYCWLKNVLTENADFAHVYVDYSLRPEFKFCRHVGAPVYGPSAGVGYEFYSHVTGPAIEYCIWDSSFPAVEGGLGVSSGYIFGSYAVNSKGGTPAFDLAHGGHNKGWLIDNTYGNGVLFGDGYFGSFESGMVHRSILTGEPADGGFRRPIDACHFVRNISVVNSRLGWTNDIAPLEYESYVNGWTGGRKSIYRLGYPNIGNTTYTGTNTSRQATTFAALDPWVKTNLVRHLNWDSATAGIVSDVNLIATSSPYSYVSDYDSIFPTADWTGAPWPAVGVDSGHTWDGANPAYVYYNATVAPPPEPAPPGRFGGGGQFVF